MRLLAAILAFAAFIIGSHRVSSQEICICGYDAYIQCDGVLEHYLSNCYDENFVFCGTDDQVIGQCDTVTTLQRQPKQELYRALKPQFPKELRQRITPLPKH